MVVVVVGCGMMRMMGFVVVVVVVGEGGYPVRMRMAGTPTPPYVQNGRNASGQMVGMMMMVVRGVEGDQAPHLGSD